mmetsp:Transcript_34601/g.66389  ORF Transcript_34601/g.66389 Transcript_34601/m.66389 type:complete len:292 (-) Transcript_34601:450-1325(-)
MSTWSEALFFGSTAMSWHLASIAAFLVCTCTSVLANAQCCQRKGHSASTTNVLTIHAHLFMLAPWGYSLWDYVHSMEVALLIYVSLAQANLITPSIDAWDHAQIFWITANLVQTLWTLGFYTHRLGLATLCAAALVFACMSLAVSLGDGLEDTSYVFIAVPVWLHAGWSVTVCMQMAHMLMSSADTSEGFRGAVALASPFLLVGVSSAAITCVGLAALPAGFVTVWTLMAVHANLSERVSDLSTRVDESTDAVAAALSLITRALSVLARAACAALCVLAAWRQTHTWQQYT